MGTPRWSKALPWLAASVLVIGGAMVALSWREPAPVADDPARPVARPAPRPVDPPAPAAAAPAPTPAPVPLPEVPSFAGSDAPARAHPVDLEALRAQLPDNLYWQLGAPTEDPDVLRQRESEERRWNALYGKVQSNTATEEEIHAYYAHRRAVSEDFLAFSRQVLARYGEQLPEQERGLYELSIRMHSTRLEELPRQIDDALARKHLQDERREAWRGAPARP